MCTPLEGLHQVVKINESQISVRFALPKVVLDLQTILR